MKNSESKAMSWGGNIYHTFEGIIPDVNDINIQGTLKYVESHVNTVGGSFKKFCSGVVQDLFPLSVDSIELKAKSSTPEGNSDISLDPVKLEAKVVTVGENSNILVDPVKREAKAVRSERHSVISTSDYLEVNLFEASSDSVTDSIDVVETQPGLVSTGDDNVCELKLAKSMESHETPNGMSKNDVNGITERGDGLLELTSPGMAESLEGLFNNEHVNTGIVLTVTAPTTSAQNREIELHSTEGSYRNVLPHDTKSDFCTPEISFETSMAVVSGGVSMTGKGLVSTGISGESTSPRRRYLHDVMSRSPNPDDLAGFVSDSPKELLSLAPASAVLTNDTEAEKLLSSSGSISLKSKDDSCVDIVVDLGMETINLHDEMKLEDSCVFIDDTVLYAVSRRARKLGSYKKKIQDIFTSKKRLAKEYEQLAIWYGDTDVDSRPSQHNSQTRHACDSDWELL